MNQLNEMKMFISQHKVPREIEEILFSLKDLNLINYYHKTRYTFNPKLLLNLPIEIIMQNDIKFKSIDHQKEAFDFFMNIHFFNTQRHLVLQKYFSNIITSDKLLKTGFQDSDLQDENLVNHLLLWGVRVPENYYKKLFKISDYTFPSLLKDNKGIWTGKIQDYLTFDKFILNNDGSYEISQLEIPGKRDFEIEKLIIENNITNLSIDLSKVNNGLFPIEKCSIYPENIKYTALYDTLFLTDFLFKYLHRMIVQIIVKDYHFSEIRKNNFAFGLEPVNGFFNISNIVNRPGFHRIICAIMIFKRKNGLKNPEKLEKIKNSYERYTGENTRQVIANIRYENIHCDYDGKNLYIQPLKMNTFVGTRYGEELTDENDHPVIMKKFIDEYYDMIKEEFPIFKRLENMLRLCALNVIRQKISNGKLPENFSIDISGKNLETKYIDNVVAGLSIGGGINLHPKNFKINYIPQIPPKIIPPENKVKKVYVIRRELGGLAKIGIFSHSGLLLETENGSKFILEYGVGPNKNVSMKMIQSNIGVDTFSDNEYTWKKQINGEEIQRSISIDEMKKIMENNTKHSDYNIISHNCHMAQERTRESIGLKVEKPYNPRTLFEEPIYNQ